MPTYHQMKNFSRTYVPNATLQDGQLRERQSHIFMKFKACLTFFRGAVLSISERALSAKYPGLTADYSAVDIFQLKHVIL